MLDLSQPPLALDNDPSSCQSSPSTLYEPTIPKKQGKKKTINSELKRQVHIQSEQKRRAQIKDGFDELRNELPSCINKKMSKVALLHKSKKKRKKKINLFIHFYSCSTYSTFKKYSSHNSC